MTESLPSGRIIDSRNVSLPGSGAPGASGLLGWNGLGVMGWNPRLRALITHHAIFCRPRSPIRANMNIPPAAYIRQSLQGPGMSTAKR